MIIKKEIKTNSKKKYKFKQSDKNHFKYLSLPIK